MGLSPPVLYLDPERQGASNGHSNKDKQIDLSRKTQVATHGGHTCSTAIYRSLEQTVHGTGRFHLRARSGPVQGHQPQRTADLQVCSLLF